MSHFHEAAGGRGAFSNMGVDRSIWSILINKVQGLRIMKLGTFQKTLEKRKVLQEGNGTKTNLLSLNF